MQRRIIKPKHPMAIRWCHWINFPLLALMLWSGLWIYWANDVYRVGVGSFTLFRFFPEGFYSAFGVDHKLAQCMAWHFFFMWFFVVNGIVYVAYTILSGEWRHLVPNRHSFREAVLVALHDLHLWKGKLPERKFNGAQQIAYTSIILMVDDALRRDEDTAHLPPAALTHEIERAGRDGPDPALTKRLPAQAFPALLFQLHL